MKSADLSTRLRGILSRGRRHLRCAYKSSRYSHTHRRQRVALPRLTRLELEIMEALWNQGASSVREIQEAFPEKDRPAYTTVQTTVYRLERKKAIRRGKESGEVLWIATDCG